MRRALCLVCTLALLLGLAGCFGGSGPEASPTPEAEPTASPSPSTRPTATPEPTVTATPEPTPPAYDPDHALDRDLHELNAQGLELPIRGATGYAAVEIGLWEVMPTPTPTPTATATAAATPAPTPTPVPAASAAPSPAAEPEIIMIRFSPSSRSSSTCSPQMFPS